tara:strand:+ start:5556 stop:6251 length:696 start_codon:yes stop_codon:yes gene_type:complete
MSNSLNFRFDDFFGGEGGKAFTESSVFPDFDDDFGGSFTDFNVPSSAFSFSQEQFELEDDFAPQSFFQQDADLGGFDDFLGEEREISLPETSLKEDIFKAFGVGKETAKAISAFAKAANRGGGKQGQAQGRGRTGPALPSSARAPTTPAGRTSRARQATSGERAVQAAIAQSSRAQSAARAIANQMARAGTVTSTNDLADMISGSTKPMGTRQKLPGANLRQLTIPRTGMA